MLRARKTAGGLGENSRQLIPAYVIWSTFCFMLFVYEPLLMYSTNKNDFWFDLGIMIYPTLMIFALFLAAGAVLITAFNLIAVKIYWGGGISMRSDGPVCGLFCYIYTGCVSEHVPSGADG